MSTSREAVDGAAQSEEPRAAVLRYHQAWKQRDLKTIMACYLPEVEPFDFAMGRALRLHLGRWRTDRDPCR